MPDRPLPPVPEGAPPSPIVPAGPPVVRPEPFGASVLTSRPRPRERYGLHAVLFLGTLLCMVYVGGVQLVGRGAVYADLGWTALVLDGLRYAVPFLFFLTVHEFGHYLAARWHGIDVSLPYYLPVPFALGTFGAVIRIREPLRRTRQLFDVGVAGPLAGFVVALAFVVVGLATLPPPTYLLGVPEHEGLVAFAMTHGFFPTWPPVQPGTQLLLFGDTLLYNALTALVPLAPPAYELQHYPLLLAGWLGLFFTALNLLPVGQLDGGHVVYALFGPRVHRVVARVTVLVLLVSGVMGGARDFEPLVAAVAGEAWGGLVWPLLAAVAFAYLWRLFAGDLRWVAPALLLVMGASAAAVLAAPAVAQAVGYSGWVLWCALLLYLVRVDHPPVLEPEPLTPARRALGYASLALFVLCFSLTPIIAAVIA